MIAIEYNNRERKEAVLMTIALMGGLLLVAILVKVTFQKDNPLTPPSPKPAIVEQVNLEDFVVERSESSGGQGGGTPSNDPVVSKPTHQTEKVLTSRNNPTNQTTSGQSTNQTAINGNNPSSSTQASNNPFGDGGNGGGSGGGSGGRFGNDYGTGGNGNGGTGNGNGRTRTNNVSLDHIETNVDVTIYLKLTVNENGDVVSAKSISSKTTTTDQRIINQVISAVKNQVKYSKDPGAGLVSVYYTALINAQ